ncbi:hypothetical protein SLEP1_g48658 [Rubroshorea leprosula]|uniref:Uncharacterized protein n=1 Tax=Rubroshorea leprosula TaxID=152421 RepID=A0AAV5LUC1_9ROSI|nr:hypothetical protein SLEP1_g48658 [Rubroshorea leprosula]
MNTFSLNLAFLSLTSPMVGLTYASIFTAFFAARFWPRGVSHENHLKTMRKGKKRGIERGLGGEVETPRVSSFGEHHLADLISLHFQLSCHSSNEGAKVLVECITMNKGIGRIGGEVVVEEGINMIVTGHVMGLRMLMNTVVTMILLDQEVFHHVAGVPILKACLLIGPMVMNDGKMPCP